MTAKEYLSQARTLDMRIKSKLQQIESLNELATSCTAVISDMPRNPNRGSSKVERAVLCRVFAVGTDTHIETVQQLLLFPSEERPLRGIQVKVRNPVEATRRNLRVVILLAVRRKEGANPVRPFDGDVVLELKTLEEAKTAGFCHTTSEPHAGGSRYFRGQGYPHS